MMHYLLFIQNDSEVKMQNKQKTDSSKWRLSCCLRSSCMYILYFVDLTCNEMCRINKKAAAVRGRRVTAEGVNVSSRTNKSECEVEYIWIISLRRGDSRRDFTSITKPVASFHNIDNKTRRTQEWFSLTQRRQQVVSFRLCSDLPEDLRLRWAYW